MAAPKKIRTSNIEISDLADVKVGLVEIIGTGIDYLKEGKVFTVHALLANTLIKKGSAILKQ